MTKPIIFIDFDEGTCHWASDGWGKNAELMAKAKKAINDGETPEEVVDLLEAAGFEICGNT